ncbi:MAG: hypothetical protein RDV48_01880, partial [Candidatus Eremiobacteraeota bacterium]|nr:hypothetical protein [Candidatus Eremiobacteraeota bacterium]
MPRYCTLCQRENPDSADHCLFCDALLYKDASHKASIRGALPAKVDGILPSRKDRSSRGSGVPMPPPSGAPQKPSQSAPQKPS